MKSGFAVAALVAASILAPPRWAAADPRIVAVGSGEVSGLYYPEAGAICRLVNKDQARHGLRCFVEPTGGSTANLAALRSGEAQLAIVQSKVLAQAVEGSGAFAKEPFPDLRSLMSLQGEALVVVLAPGAKIKSGADLKGKRVNLGRPGSFQRLMAEALLGALSLSPQDLSAALDIDEAKAPQALCHNEIDAAVFTGLHPLAEVQEAMDDCGATLLPLKDGTLDALIKANPAFVHQTIAQDTYSGTADRIPTFGVGSVLVTTASMPAEDAYEVVKAVYDNLDAFTAMYPPLGGLDRKQMAHDALVAPLHDGALRYYKENGLR